MLAWEKINIFRTLSGLQKRSRISFFLLIIIKLIRSVESWMTIDFLSTSRHPAHFLLRPKLRQMYMMEKRLNFFGLESQAGITMNF